MGTREASPVLRYKAFIKDLFTIVMGTRVLALAFLHPAPDDPIVNRLTAAISTHKLCHVELVFEGAPTSSRAFSIFLGTTAGFRAKTFGNPDYEMVSLSVSASEYEACLRFCAVAHSRNYTLDSAGMYASAVHPGCAGVPSHVAGKTFCSKIITEALQAAGVDEVQGLCPSAVTPSRLYAAVKNSQRRTCTLVRVNPLKPLLM